MMMSTSPTSILTTDSTSFMPSMFTADSCWPDIIMDTILTEQIQELIDALLKDETKATRLLQTARAHDLSFGLAYNHVDDDIAQLIGRLRYMLFLAQRHSPPIVPPNQ
jgi:hypothetical protein